MTRAHRLPRLSAFERLPEQMRGLVQAAIDRVAERSASQGDAYTELCRDLREAGIQEQDIPGFSSFNRLVLRNGPSAFTMPPSQTALFNGQVSRNSLQLLAIALRSIADDLDVPADGEAPTC